MFTRSATYITIMTSIDQKHIQTCITLSQSCPSTETAFSVGALLLSPSSEILATGYSRQTGRCHAEEHCFISLLSTNRAAEIKGATLYTTMEPCGDRKSGSKSCCDWILELGVKRVVYAIREPNVFIEHVRGLERLEEAGIEVVKVDGFEEACLAPNRHIL